MRFDSPPGASANTSSNVVVGAGASGGTSANIAIWAAAAFASAETSANVGSNFASAGTSANLVPLFASAGTSANLAGLFASAGTSANLVPLFASAATSANLATLFASAGTSANLASAATSANVASWVTTNFASANTSSNLASAATSANIASWANTTFASAGTSANVASAATSSNIMNVVASVGTSANVLSVAGTRFLSVDNVGSRIIAGTNVSVSASALGVVIHAAAGVGGGASADTSLNIGSWVTTNFASVGTSANVASRIFSPSRVYVRNQQTVSGTTPVTASGLQFSLLANNYYQFEFNLIMRTGTNTTGPRVTLTVPTNDSFAAYAWGPFAADGTGNTFRGEITAGSDAVVFTSVPGLISASVAYFYKVEGAIRATGNGNLACLFANETGTVPVRVDPGSNGILWNLTSA